MQTIADLKIGQEVISYKNDKGIITAKTKRTVTITFQNGNIVKYKYKHSDYFEFKLINILSESNNC